MSRILRYEVPVVETATELELSGPIVYVDSRRADVVEVWALDSGGPTVTRAFYVVGTGHTFPDEWRHVGTAIVAGGMLVWHLCELPR